MPGPARRIPVNKPAPTSQPAFHGYRVLDFTQVVAGPFAAQLLGASGADVIKVEGHGGDQLRRIFKTTSQHESESSGAFAAVNRGKQSIALNLKDPKGRDAALRIAAQCDVFVENFRPGVIKRLGLDYETVRQLRPDVIYCSISGFGQSGPLAPQSAYDGGIQAASGMMSTTGHPETGPVRAGYLPVDTPTGLLAAFAIASALLRRERTGLGQYLDVAMLDAALLLQMPAVSMYLQDGTINGLRGNTSPARSPLANTFKASDGFLAVSVVTPVHGKAALTCLGLPETLWDDYLNHPPGSPRVRQIDGQIHQAFETRTVTAWESELRSKGLSVEPVNQVPGGVELARRQGRPVLGGQLSASADSHISYGGAYAADNDGPRFAGTTPEIGEHGELILRQFGFTDQEIAEILGGTMAD